MATETSKSIYEWGQAAFGPVSDHNRVIARALLEFDELAEAVAQGASVDAIAAEAADVAILLNRLLGLLGRELGEEVDAKMKINRARKWTRNGDGTGRHV
jgi:NTP pyrophosphatase (non-canonical NTP hydrolase)